MLLAGVLKVLIGLSALSQYKLWTLGHEHNSSSAWFLNFGPPENGDQDTLETWLFGPVKNVPINGLDCPLRWLYGPFLTQRPPQEPVEVKEQVPTVVPNSVSKHVHEQVDPKIEIKDPHDNWVHGPNPDYLVNSGSEDKGFLSRIFTTPNPEPNQISKKQEILELDSDDESKPAPKVIVKKLDQTIQLESEQTIHLDSDSDKEDDFIEEHLVESPEPEPPSIHTLLTPEAEAASMPLKRKRRRAAKIEDDDNTVVPETEIVTIEGVQYQTAPEQEEELIYSDDETETPEAEDAAMPLKTKIKRDADLDDESTPIPVVIAQRSEKTIHLDSDEEEDSNEDLVGGFQPKSITQSQLQPQIQAFPQIKPQIQAFPQIKSQIQTLPQIKPQIQTLPQIKPQIQTLPQIKPQIQTLPQIKPQLQTITQPQTEPIILDDSMDIPLDEVEDVRVTIRPKLRIPVEDQEQEQQQQQQQQQEEQEQEVDEEKEEVRVPTKIRKRLPVQHEEVEAFPDDDEGELIVLDSDPEVEIEQETKPEDEQGTAHVSEPEKKSTPDTESKSEQEDEPSSELESNSEAEDISSSEPETKTDPEKKTATKKKKKSFFRWRSKSKAKEAKIPVKEPEAKPTPETETISVQETETKTEPEKKPEPEPEPEPKPEVKPLADLKLYEMDPNTLAYVELDQSKFELMEELGEVNYSLKKFVHCHLITYCDEKVWSKGDNGVDDPESISCDPENGQITVNGTKKAVMYREDGSGNWQYVSSFNYAPEYREIFRTEISDKDKTDQRQRSTFPQGKTQQIQGPTTGVPAILKALSPESFQLYTEDEGESSLKLDKQDYKVTREGNETDVEFKPDKKCTEIKFDNKRIWKKGDYNISVPTSISYNQLGSQVTIRDREKEVTYQRDLLGMWKYQSTARYDSEFTPFGLTSTIMGSPDYRTDFGALFREHPPHSPTMPPGPAILEAIRADPFQLFTEDESETSLEMDQRDYSVSREGYETDFEFKPDKKCTEIKFDNKSIWRKGDHNINVPTSVSYNDDGSQVTIRDGERAIILVRDQSGDWYCRTAAKYHYDFGSMYRSSHHDEDYALKAKMKTVLASVDLKKDKRSVVEYDYKEEKKKKIMTYTTKPGYEFGSVKYDGHTIWQTNHRDGFCSEVIFNNMSSKVRSVVLKMNNGTQKEFQFADKKWKEFLPPQPVAAGTQVRDEFKHISEPSKTTSQILETEAESERDDGSDIELSGSDIELSDTEEEETGDTIELPESSTGIIVQLPQLPPATTVETSESEPEITTQPTVTSGITVPFPQAKVESLPEPGDSKGNVTGMLQSDTQALYGKKTPGYGAAMEFPQSDVESIIELPHSDMESLFDLPAFGLGSTMDFPQSDVESIIEMAHSDTESLFEMPKPGSTLTMKRPQSDAESAAGDQKGSMIPDPNFVHNALCQKLKAERVDSNVDKGILCFKTKFVDMTIWSRRYGHQNTSIPILSRSLYALFYNGSTWESQ
ncbi:hypothetical protein MACK_002331 [Theileria orientalis]|uniref:Uncharacterized protein n=1 Tax=Theileria orientalis TaxID=68886 RepID=A0A976QU83_THEOR|nr:hypothetical protein MACK_002331 [Theileria orientalis]